MPLVRWSPTIEAGHLLQAFTIAASVIGGAVTGYITVLHLTDKTEESIALLTQELAQEHTALGEVKQAQHDFIDKTSGTLDKIQDQVVQLKVLVASGQKDRR